MWIHEYDNWTTFTWDSEAIGQKLAAVRHKQGRLLGRMEGLGFDIRQEASLDTLTNDVVTSSAIEGETLSRSDVRSSLAQHLGIERAGIKPPKRDIDGIVEIMLDATQNYTLSLTEERLFAWHSALFPTGRSGMHKITVGAWRTDASGSMQVVSGAIGRQKVHFEAPSAKRLNVEMQAFLQAFNAPQAGDPVLKAGIAHLWFVTIHPFEDGNGRIARAIADMALTQADNTTERFYSMSMQIEAERKQYYEQLERQQRSSPNITEWLLWFLECLERAIHKAEETLQLVMYKANLWDQINKKLINERQQLIINRMLHQFQGHMNTSKYAKLAKCSNDTALRDIKKLVQRGILIQNTSGGRSTSYRLAAAEEVSYIIS